MLLTSGKSEFGTNMSPRLTQLATTLRMVQTMRMSTDAEDDTDDEDVLQMMRMIYRG